MGSSYYRERRYKEEWTRRVELTLLFRLQVVYDAMRRRLAGSDDHQIKEWASEIRRILASINGEVTNIRLDDKQLPNCGLQDLVEVATEPPALKILTRK